DSEDRWVELTNYLEHAGVSQRFQVAVLLNLIARRIYAPGDIGSEDELHPNLLLSACIGSKWSEGERRSGRQTLAPGNQSLHHTSPMYRRASDTLVEPSNAKSAALRSHPERKIKKYSSRSVASETAIIDGTPAV